VASLKESLGPFNPAHNDVLVRRQPGGHLELPREVVDAEVGGRRHLLQGRAAIEVFLDADPPPPVARRGRLVGEESEPVQRPDRLPPPWPLLSYDCLPKKMACIRRISPLL